MSALREAFAGILSALVVSLLVVGALALAITENMVVPEAVPSLAAPATPLGTEAGSEFPELSTATPTRRPTARLVAAATLPAVTACQPGPAWERYTTQPGDTLDALAASHGTTPEKLIEANCLSGASIIPNTQLYLPRPTPTATLEALTPTLTLTSSPTPRPCGPPAGWTKYTIRAKDTLTRLSLIYRVRISDIQFANCMGTSIFLAEGEPLYVPNVAPNYTATPTDTPAPPTPVPPTPVPPTALPTTVPAPAVTLAISSSPAGYDTLAQSITYAYTLRNSGNVALSGPFAVSDDKNPSVACPGAPASLAPTATLTCSATYKITQADLDSGSLTNQASATARYNGQTISSRKVSFTLLASQKPDLTVTNKASPDTYNAKDQVITFTITVYNSGNVTLTAPIVSDDPGPVACASLPAALAPGAAFTCGASYKITQADLDAGTSITNNAGATMKFGSLTISSKLATAKCIAVQMPALALAKSGILNASSVPPTAGKDTISYTYKLKNTGNVTLKGPAAVVDDKTGVSCPGTPTTLAPGAGVDCTAVYILKPADITAGSVTNKATAQFGTTASSQVTVTVPLPLVDPNPFRIGP